MKVKKLEHGGYAFSMPVGGASTLSIYFDAVEDKSLDSYPNVSLFNDGNMICSLWDDQAQLVIDYMEKEGEQGEH